MRETAIDSSNVSSAHSRLGTPNSTQGIAPGKIILFGEHAVNRGQTAISASVGLLCVCTVTTLEDGPYRFVSEEREEMASREDILRLLRQVEEWRQTENYPAIRSLARERFFAPQQYLLASALGEGLPIGLLIEYKSEISSNSGLGSGGAAYVALSRALADLMGMDSRDTAIAEMGRWAQLGDVIAHGGIASGLDTQTSLHGQFIQYSVDNGFRYLAWDNRLSFVVAHCGTSAATSEVNGRVKAWLAERPSRIHYFREIGLLAELAKEPLAHGDAERLGHLMNLNQLILEKIGVSCSELDRLIDAALDAGATGAKLSGSGGGGVMVALTTAENRAAVIDALRIAGGTVYDAPLGVPGAYSHPLVSESESNTP